MTQWLVHVSFISVTEVLVTQWLEGPPRELAGSGAKFYSGPL